MTTLTITMVTVTKCTIPQELSHYARHRPPWLPPPSPARNQPHLQSQLPPTYK